ncbi:MAG: pyrroloquinoline quinone-dependent dehydrogenase, partial [Candidatus Glassbacteria bacterium]
TGDRRDDPPSTIECNPIVVNGTMYLTSAFIRVFAVDPENGAVRWVFDPFEGSKAKFVNRGVSWWSDGRESRIFVVADHWLYSLYAGSGRPVSSFGSEGRIDLREGLDRPVDDKLVGATTPGLVYKDLLILGSYNDEGPPGGAPGHIRAIDVRTGQRRWIFHTIPHPGEFGSDTWEEGAWQTAGSANCWGGMSLDRKRGVVYIATGSPSFDFYGGDRKGQNLFGNCVVALRADTGERVWHFQTVHHDLWDYDLPCAPNLVTIDRGGRRIEAVAQVTKTGQVFVLDRDTGAPVFGVEERLAPPSTLEGEEAWPTQPFALAPPPFACHGYTEDLVTGISAESHDSVLERFRAARAGEIFTPPSLEGTLVYPGFHGGANWSGAGFDPGTGVLYVNANELPWLLTMVDAEPGRPFRYNHTGYHRFLDPEGYPAVKPPWGTLNAIDLNEGKIRWQVPLGEFAELTARGIPPTGTENFGGTIVTAGGLVFIGATKDEKFRAFDKDTGRVLWEYQLPAGGYATPCTYLAGGRQFVVIAAGGGGKLGTKSGDSYLAFALPNK